MLTARSVGAARGIVEIYNFLVRNPLLSITVLSQEPATSIFVKENISCVHAPMPAAQSATDAVSEELQRFVLHILGQNNPQAVIVGLSTPGEGGVDEAALRHAKCPTYMLQDFWGDSNLFYDKHPDNYLVADDDAAELTLERQGRKAIVLGSPRHARYADIDFLKRRQQSRKRWGFSAGDIVHGLFDQPLWEIPGYQKMIEHWIQAVAQSSAKSIYRPHPATPNAQKAAIITMFEDLGVKTICLDSADIEDCLVTCSTASFAMSNTAVDAAYINYYSPSPMVVPIYLLTEGDLEQAMQIFVDADQIPAVKQELALLVKSNSEIAQVLQRASSTDLQREIWQASKALGDPMQSLQKLQNILLDAHGMSL